MNAPSADRPEVLPLFRPEAVAAQHKIYGEILLARPLSLLFLTVLLGSLAIGGLALLTLGHYQDTAVVSGLVLSEADHGSTAQAIFFVPGKWMQHVPKGTSLSLHWQSCSGRVETLKGVVSQISRASLEETRTAGLILARDEAFRVTVSFPIGFSVPATPDGRVDAEFPRGRRRLIEWPFVQARI